MLSNDESICKSINELTNVLERATQKEVDISIEYGELKITITNKNKQALDIPIPGNLKLQDIDDELDSLHSFVTSLPEDGIC